MEYFDDIRFHACLRRFLPEKSKLFTADTHSMEFIKNGRFFLQHESRCYELSAPVLFWMKRSDHYCLRIPPVHRIGEHRFRHCGHSEVVKPIMIRHQSTFNFTQRILPGDLRIKAGQELLPCRKRLAIMVPGQVFKDYSKRYRGMKLKSC